MRKSEIRTHNSGYGRSSRPAVNIKVDLWGAFTFELLEGIGGKDFARWWIDMEDNDQQANGDMVEEYHAFAAESAFEDAQNDAEYHFGSRVKVYQEGRSGGWLVVENLPDLEEWDAIMVGKWATFQKGVEAMVEAFPESLAEMVYINTYDSVLSERSKQANMEAKWAELSGVQV